MRKSWRPGQEGGLSIGQLHMMILAAEFMEMQLYNLYKWSSEIYFFAVKYLS